MISAETTAKAIALLEAMTGPHDAPYDHSLSDHRWRECRRCLAMEEADTKSGRKLLSAALAIMRALPPAARQRRGKA